MWKKGGLTLLNSEGMSWGINWGIGCKLSNSGVIWFWKMEPKIHSGGVWPKMGNSLWILFTKLWRCNRWFSRIKSYGISKCLWKSKFLFGCLQKTRFSQKTIFSRGAGGKVIINVSFVIRKKQFNTFSLLVPRLDWFGRLFLVL